MLKRPRRSFRSRSFRTSQRASAPADARLPPQPPVVVVAAPPPRPPMPQPFPFLPDNSLGFQSQLLHRGTPKRHGYLEAIRQLALESMIAMQKPCIWC